MPAKRKPSVSSARHKQSATSTTPAKQQAAAGSGIPFALRLLLVVLSSLGLSSLLYSLSTEITAGDLALISKRLDTWWGVGGLVAWRTVELSLGWFLGYDGMSSSPSLFNDFCILIVGRRIYELLFSC
jgi:hypothetical protein